MKKTIIFLSLVLLFSCKKEEKISITPEKNAETTSLPISGLPNFWFNLTLKEGKTYIFEPCEHQNESFRIYKATTDYVEENVSIYKKGDWVMIFETGQDGVYYSDLILEKKEQNYELKAKNWQANKTFLFKISNYNVKNQTASWDWIDEDNVKKHLEMVTGSGRKNFKIVNENCDDMEEIID